MSPHTNHQRWLFDVGFDFSGLLPDLPPQPAVSSPSIKDSTSARSLRRQSLAIGLDGEAIVFACQELIDRIHGRDQRLRITFIRIEQAAWRRCGNPACAGQPQDDRARNEVFFSGAITSSLGQDASAVRDARGVGEGDVKSMLASTRAIADQRRRGAKANQIGARRRQFGCARGPVRFVPSRLRCRSCRPGPAQSRETPQALVRRKEFAPRSDSREPPGTRSSSPTAPLPPSNRQCSLAARRVRCGDQLSPRGVHRAHGAVRS